MRRLVPALLAPAVVTAPLTTQAADLVVWWDEGYYAEEHEAIREIIAAFERGTGKQVELVFHPESEHGEAIAAALEAGKPPDFAFGLLFSGYVGQWAFDGRLVDLSHAIGHFSDLFDPDVLSWELWLNARAGQKGAVRAADWPNHVLPPCLEEPSRARGLHACGHTEGVGGLLVVLV
jgi:ABC-type glycerol-3-phosphate transport system substrate-binding protein